MARIMYPRCEIFSYDSKDFKKITALRRGIFCDEVGEKPSFIKDERDASAIHVAFCLGDDVVGCGSAYDIGNNVFEMSKICVDKNYRRFKVGTQIIEEIRRIAKEKGALQLVCEGYAENIDFFKSNGIPYENVSYIKNNKRRIQFRENLVF